MTRRLVQPPGLHPAPGFSHVAISTGTTWFHFAGQVALDPDFQVVGNDLASQTRAAMTNLQLAMAECGVDWEDIVRRTIYTTEPSRFDVITAAIHEVTGQADDPPQSIIGVTGLAIEGLLIEIECTALRD
jgi:enamine deaminase RidA (YjgF/YER057c/UK114 family)